MCRRLDSIRAQGLAADRLTAACNSNLAAEERVADERPSIERILHRVFGAAALTPTDMLHKLGRMK